MKLHKRIAAIDIGTNSFHLIIAEANVSTGRFKTLTREKEIVRLGSGSSDMKYLSENAMARGIETLKRFKRMADAARAPIRAAATSAVREALNQDEFRRRVKEETDIKIEIVSGMEEARLIYLGVLQALPVFGKQILLIDIGGGSTEFLIGKQRKISYDNSLKIGAVRLTHRYFTSKNLERKSVKQCRQYISGLMNPVSRAVRELDLETVVGTSGTILNIANMIQCEREEDPPIRLNNFSFSRDELDSIAEKVIRAKDAKQRSKIDGLDPNRTDIIVAGVLILQQVFKEFKIKEMTVSEFALREGLILDTIEKAHKRSNGHPLDDIRYNSVLHLAENFGYEKQHSQHVALLSMRIFDQTKKLHVLGKREREYLEAAAILHEIGLFVSHVQHHWHSYYLIRNGELLGFTENEKAIIANVARYHRKSHPKYKHEGYQNLSAEDQEVVTKLASILRIADGLDRTHASLITDVLCKLSKKAAVLKLRREPRSHVELEIWGADRKKDLFESTFDLIVRFELV